MSKTVWIINQYASTPDSGFAGRHYYLGKELAKLGYNVYLIASSAHHLLREKPDMRSEFEFQEEDNRFNVVWVRMPHYEQAHSKSRIIGWFLFSRRIRKLAKIVPDSPDVIVCSSPSLLSFFGAKSLARRFSARLVFEVRDIWPMTLMDIGGYSPRHPFIRFLQWVEDRAYRDSDRVVSNLKNAVEHMVERGMEKEKFSWIPNGFSLEEVSQNAPLNNSAKKKIPQDKFLIGYTGTLGVANSLYTLIDAAERLRDFPEIAFILVGDGKEKATLQKRVLEKGLVNVHFINPIPKVEIQAMLSQFDGCYIGLSKDPLFRFGVSPNKLFDYLYSGKPIIYGIESGNYKPVEDAGAGFQIPSEDAKQLEDAVLKLYRMEDSERAQMGANGRKVALEQYEYGQLAENLAKVLFD
ncbi:glycosyltransferase family 4 protein [Idiomarina sp. HP20-50]|uniref:glycosyltransferase family 4 protein n=1 Tax=Idiomarina sp. HP20-50 TaxID=3070813 RepID=UPI00294B6179|nr:glycosyltransferase family 4 protein [Idiomarina sp. HP20-50]MDV6316113.1 glycosyltransferase family 4 protein [Idiomarina sp. HP20-50]